MPMRLVLLALLLLLELPVAVLATEIPKGTHLLLRLENSISTRNARSGDRVYFRTGSPIVVNDRIVVPVNSYVQGVITSASRGGRVSKRAELRLRLDTLTLPSGKTVHFSGTLDSVEAEGTTQTIEKDEGVIRQGSNRGRDAGTILVTAGGGAAVGAMVDRSVRGAAIGGGAGSAVGLARVMLTRGQDVELRRGGTLDIVLARPLVIE